jgi:23S rRNA pseudouridine2605 synthase
MDHSQRGCGVIRHNQTEVLSPNATVGVVYHGKGLQCHRVKVQKSSGLKPHLGVVLTQGKKRESRRLFKALGHEMTRLRCIQYGPFKLEDLPSDAWHEIPIMDVRKAFRQ